MRKIFGGPGRALGPCVVLHRPSPTPTVPQSRPGAQSRDPAAEMAAQAPGLRAVVVGNRSLASSRIGEFPAAVSQDQREKAHRSDAQRLFIPVVPPGASRRLNLNQEKIEWKE